MDLKIDFSELIGKIRDLLKEDGPTAKVKIIMNDGSLAFSDMEIEPTMIPCIGDMFEACSDNYWKGKSIFTKVKVLHRELSYYGYHINEVILTVEKV